MTTMAMHFFDLASTPSMPWKNGGGSTQELACWHEVSEHEVSEIEEEKRMQYVTSVEKNGIQQGVRQGSADGECEYEYDSELDDLSPEEIDRLMAELEVEKAQLLEQQAELEQVGISNTGIKSSYFRI